VAEGPEEGLSLLPRNKFSILDLKSVNFGASWVLFYSIPKAGLNAVPTVKITVGTPFPGIPAGNDPWGELSCSALPAAKRFFCYFQVENGE